MPLFCSNGIYFDGVSDFFDIFPLDPYEQIDADEDGLGNNTDLDDDNDGVADDADAFPLDASESADSDLDGVGDNADAFPFDTLENTDTDSDGTGDNADAFPNDSTQWADRDGDGYGDNLMPSLMIHCIARTAIMMVCPMLGKPDTD